MRSCFAATSAFTFAIALVCGAFAGDLELKDDRDKTSYSVGFQIGENLRATGITVDLDLFMRGFEDATAQKEPAMSLDEIRGILSRLRLEVVARQMRKHMEEARKNKKESEAFLAENKRRKGVATTDSGLQYEILRKGEGESPEPGDTVTVHYTGTLIDGTLFDSSFERGEPARIPVDGVIPGWTEALKKMHEGCKWKLYVPPELAYGEHGKGAIPPNAALIFEVELLSVEKADGGKEKASF
ncbi:MAG: FKBP-type peptidyl-prolyl cis-trans isomerase [Deltaproteobacteria bacterium]|nr:FKBP-type peptidyl-prolyl cis-trans isomerase [Deltaproteobacteria bacterium]